MTTPKNQSRRRFLQRAAVGTLLAFGGSTLLAACASTGGDDSGSSGGGAGKTADNPFGMADKATVDAVIFNGGYGIDYVSSRPTSCRRSTPGVDGQGLAVHPDRPGAAAALRRRQPAGPDRQLRRRTRSASARSSTSSRT